MQSPSLLNIHSFSENDFISTYIIVVDSCYRDRQFSIAVIIYAKIRQTQKNALPYLSTTRHFYLITLTERREIMIAYSQVTSIMTKTETNKKL